MSFRLEMQTGNAAFGDQPGIEVARLLRQAAENVEAGALCENLSDLNGNPVGFWRLEMGADHDQE